MSKQLVYGAFDPPPAGPLKFEGPEAVSKTRQSESAACDINVIMKRFEVSGVLPPLMTDPIYADVSEMGDYRTALDQVEMVSRTFMQLPAEKRKLFENDPAVFVDFVSQASEEELRRLELLAPKVEEAPSPGSASEGAAGPPGSPS